MTRPQLFLVALVLASVGLVGLVALAVGEPAMALIALPLLIAIPVGRFLLLMTRSFVVLPLALYGIIASDEAGRVLGTTDTMAKWLGVSAVLLLVLRGLLEQKLSVPRSSSWWFLAFTSWVLISLLWSIEPRISGDAAVTLGGLVVVSILLGLNRLSDKELTCVREAIIVGGALIASISVEAYAMGRFEIGDADGVSGLPRLMGSLGSGWLNPNGLTAALFLPLAFALWGMFAHPVPWLRLSSGIAFTIMIVAVLLAQSRAGMLGVAVLVLTIARPLRRVWLATGAVAFIAVGMLTVGWESWTLVADRFSGEKLLYGTGRADIWDLGLQAMSSAWVGGLGLGTFKLAFGELGLAAGRFLDADPHNIYLQLGVEVGVVGILLFFAAMISVLRGLRGIRPGIDGPVPAVCLVGALAAFLLYAAFHGILRAKLFWLTVGLAMLVARPSGRQVQPEPIFLDRETQSGLVTSPR